MDAERLGAEGRTVRAVWGWWLRELADLFPWLAAWFAGGSRVALIRATEAAVSLSLKSGAPAGEQTWPVALDSMTIEQADSIRKASRNQLLELAMPASTVHRLVVQLPSAARGGNEAVRYALLSASPLSIDAIVFDWRAYGLSQRDGWIDVEVWLCRKAVMVRHLDHLAGLGLSISRVGIAHPEAPGRLALTLHRNGNTQGWIGTRLRALLLGCAALCLLGTVVATGAVATWQERGLQRAIEALAAKHRQVAPLAKRQARLQAIDEGVARLNVSPLSSVLDELARVIPKEAWLTQVQYQAGQLKVTGRSSDPGAVLPALRNSRMFKDTRMDVLNAMNAGSDGAATFELTLSVAPLR